MLTNRIVSLYARLPNFRGKRRIFGHTLRHLPFSYAQSFYGVKLVNRKGDLTFEFALLGSYGDFIVSVIRGLSSHAWLLDIGANQGIFSLFAASNIKLKTIVAIEANPYVFGSLVANLELNSAWNVVALCGAVTAANGSIVRLSHFPEHTGRGHIADASRQALHDAWTINLSDDVLIEIGEKCSGPGLIKIDVEGSELDVLSKLKRVGLLKSANRIIVETDLYGNRRDKIFISMQEEGLKYCLQHISGDHADLLFSRD